MFYLLLYHKNVWSVYNVILNVFSKTLQTNFKELHLSQISIVKLFCLKVIVS